MASTSKCPYCGSTVRSDERSCPNCGAVNEHFVQDSARKIVKPRTIAELKEYCAERGMPLLRMRFFIGEDYREPKAFGIYRDGEDVVVYKNKADGTRAVRYEGKDEAYAVNEIYQKMKAEIIEERQYSADHPVHKSGSGSGKNKRTRKSTTPSIMKILGIIFGAYMSIGIIIGIITAIFAGDVKNTGYYKYDDTLYYQRNGNWYYYDEDYGDWYATTVDDELNDNYDDYFEAYSYDDSYGGSDYSSSDSYYDNYYDTDNNWDDDWDDDDWDYDSGSDWDSGWDSGYDSDWDSDW